MSYRKQGYSFAEDLTKEAYHQMKTKGWLWFYFRRPSRALLPILLVLLISLPALFSSCSKDSIIGETAKGFDGRRYVTTLDINIEESITKAGKNIRIEKIEYFIFNEDSLKSLDSYRKSNLIPKQVELQSSGGNKRLVVLVNSQLGDEEIIRIDCYPELAQKRVSMDHENLDAMFLSGEAAFIAGQRSEIQIILRPELSEVYIRDISCDFGGTIYQGQKIKDLKFYLCDVSRHCQCLQDGSFSPSGILNYRKPRDSDLALMDYPSLISTSWPLEEVEEKIKRVGISLFCYPNNLPEETLGAPYTSLVIEGNIAGEKRYYKIPINRENGGNGIGRNVRYCLDLRLTSIGSSSPDDWRFETGDNLDMASLEIVPGNYISGHSGESIHISCKTYPEWMKTEFCIEDLEFDKERGIYDYILDEDSKGVTLKLLKGGSGMFTVSAEEPLNDYVLVFILVDP